MHAFHFVKRLFTLTSAGFYLQCGGRQENPQRSPGGGRELAGRANLRSRSLRAQPRAKRRTSAGASKSLQKAMRILFHMGQNGPEMGITQLALALSLNKTTVHRLLNAMEKFELIEKTPDSDRYR